MARARKASDDAYNARRRYKRQAERLKREAAKQGGVVGTRLEKQADRLIAKARRTYQGADTPYRQERLIRESELQLVSKRGEIDDSARREAEAKEIMKTVAGRRIYAATTDVWEDSGYEDRDVPIVAFFNADDLMQVIEIFERLFGSDLYKEPASEDYPSDSVTLNMMLELARYKNNGQEV